MAQTLTIDASALGGSGFKSATYFSDFFSGLASGSGLFYGGTPDAAFGSTYYMNGSQQVRHFTDGEDAVSSAIMLEGADIAYDFIHHGAHLGHGITGSVDTAYFGDWIDGTTTGTEGTGAAGEVQNFGVGVVVDGLGLSAEAGAGADASTNAAYAIYKAVQDLDAAGLETIFSEYAVEMTGTSSADRLVGFGNEDVLIGRAGADVLVGRGAADILIGGRGADILKGGNGKDMLLGGLGDDLLKGGKGADVLKGGSGDDILTGGKGRDVLSGGNGADTFVFATNSGSDRVTDFDITEDMIDVSALGHSSLDDFTITDGADGIVLASGAIEITLLDVASVDLTDAMFTFA